MARVPVEMSRERFEELVGEALDEVPERAARLMSNVVILVEDEPPAGEPRPARPLRGARADRARLGLRRACCPTGSPSTAARPCAICATEDDVVDEVAVTVVHEIAHHFGIDDERLHELGWG